MNAWTLCRCRLAWAFAGCYILAIAASTGCSLPKKQGSMGALTTAKQFNDVWIAYRTESDRVNLAAAGLSGQTQMVSFQQPSHSPLPNVTTTTLQIQQPHPHGIPGYAQAKVFVRPNGAEESEGGSFWSRLVGGSDDQDAGNHNAQIIEAWLLDIPAWQVNGIMAKLQEQNFFRRAKVLNAETFLAVKADGVGFGKKYRSVPELDTLILRVRREGRPAGQRPHAPNRPQYAPNRPQYAPNRPQYAPNQPQYAPNQPQYAPNQPQHVPVQPSWSPAQPLNGPIHGRPGTASRFVPPAPPGTRR